MEILERSILERLKESILDAGTDLTAEAIAAGLIHAGLPADQVIIRQEGTSKRSFRKDVSGFHTEFSDYDDKEYLFLHTHRAGIYDALPENLFHQPKGGRTEKNKYEIIDEIKAHREEESYARKFFLPLEFEYSFIRTLLYSIEEEFEKNISNSKLIEIFAEYFPVLRRLDTHHAFIFLRIIPLIHNIRNDFELVSKSISMILNADIEIILVNSGIHSVPHPAVGLGDAKLGEDMIIGNSVYDGEMDILVKAGPFRNHRIEEYLKGGSLEGLIEELCDYFLGAEYFLKVEYQMEPLEECFELEGGKVILGINSRI
jgi:type VI secretion system protein ImpH